MADVDQALILQVSADTSKALKAIDKLNSRLAGIAPEMERHGRKAAEGLEKGLGGFNLGKALDKVFDSSRLAVLEEGTSRFRVMGSAVEELGAAGIVGAAGVAALTIALEHTEKAIEYAAGIAKVGKEVGVSTDFIQKFNFAAHQNEIEVGAADAALKGLNASLGLVQSGLARKQTVNAFAALLGTDPAKTPEILRQYQNIGDFFPVLADRIAGVGNAAERAAIAKRLGFEDLLPMLTRTENGFASLSRKAEDLGIVMSHSAIEKAEEAKQKLSELEDVMKARANATFVEFSDTLIKIKEGFLAAEKAGLSFLAAITGTEPTSAARLLELQAEVARLTDKGGKPTSAFFAGQVEHDRAAIARMQKELAEKPEDPSAKDKARQLVPPPAKPKGADQTASFGKSALDALGSGREAVARANAALVVGILAHADAEKAAVDTVLAKKLGDREAEAQKIAAAKNDADKLAQRAKINSAKAAEAEGAEAQKRLIDIQAETALRAQNLQIQRADAAAIEATLRYQESAAVTAQERNALADRILAREQDLERRELNDKLDSSTYKGSAADAVQERADLAARQLAARNQQALDQQGPLDKYLRGIQDLNTEFQTDGVQAIESLTSGLIDAALHAKNLGDVLKNTFLTLLQQVLTQSLTKEAAPGLAQAGAALLHFLPGFASGTSSAPGGLALVGERGPELVNLPKGAGVTPTFQTLQALSAMKAPRSQPTVIGGPTYVLNSPVMTQDLLDQMNQISAAHGEQAAQRGRGLAVKDIQRAAYLGDSNK